MVLKDCQYLMERGEYTNLPGFHAILRALCKEAMGMFYELRRYTIRKGKMKQWVRLMGEEIIPLQVSMGMVISGSFTAEEDDTLYVWLRRFASEAERKRLYAKVYGSAQWKKVIGPKVEALLDMSSIVVNRLVPTAKSVLQ
jgi:hypothetical protein